jgi:hypothetical protein
MHLWYARTSDPGDVIAINHRISLAGRPRISRYDPRYARKRKA